MLVYSGSPVLNGAIRRECLTIAPYAPTRESKTCTARRLRSYKNHANSRINNSYRGSAGSENCQNLHPLIRSCRQVMYSSTGAILVCLHQLY